LLYIDPTGEEIIVTGGTADQRTAVSEGIERLRNQSANANSAFARFDGTGPDAADLTITILDDADFEAQVTSTDASKAQGITQAGQIVENIDPKTHTSTFIVDVNVSLRSSAINLGNDRSDAQNRRESRTEAILSHEVGGHAVDLSRNPREYNMDRERGNGVEYKTRPLEKSANLTSHRILTQRLFGGHIRSFQSGLHWLY
jgi:hypothetical protein